VLALSWRDSHNSQKRTKRDADTSRKFCVAFFEIELIRAEVRRKILEQAHPWVLAGESPWRRAKLSNVDDQHISGLSAFDIDWTSQGMDPPAVDPIDIGRRIAGAMLVVVATTTLDHDLVAGRNGEHGHQRAIPPVVNVAIVAPAQCVYRHTLCPHP
jgi:hypothetical protein